MTAPDGAGHATTYDYNSSGLLSGIVNPDGTTDTYKSVQAAALLAAAGSAPPVASAVRATETDELTSTEFATTSTAFDAFGDPTSVTNALGQTTTYVRDANGLVTEMIQPDPNPGHDSGPLTTYYGYDSEGDLTSQQQPDGSYLDWTYQAETGTYGGLYEALQESVDELGHPTWYTIDPASGDVLAVEQVLGTTENPSVDPITHYTYTPAPTYSSDPPAGLVVSQTDPLGNVTQYQYNAHGLLTQTTYADNSTTINAYDTSDNLTTQTNQLGYITTYAYDQLGRVTSETEPAPYTGGTAPVLNFIHDADGNVTEEIDLFDNTIHFTHDDCDRLASETDPDNYTTSYTYNGLGEMLSITDARSHVTTYAYDALGRETSVTAPGNEVTTFTYDNLGDLLSQTDAMGNTTRYAYNDRGERVNQTDPDGGLTTYTYDLAGNMRTMTDPDGNQTRWTYDNLNRTIQETECVGTSSQATAYYGYDPAGHLVQSTDYDGHVIQYVYNNLGREINENWMSGSTVALSMTFSYDLAGELLSASDPSSATDTYTYDHDGNNTSITASYAGLTPSVMLQKLYDTNGYVTDVYAYIGGTADFHNSYTYDYSGNVMSVAQQDDANNGGNYQNYSGHNAVSSKLVTFSYDQDRNMTAVSRYVGLVAQSGDLVAASAYTYDSNSNLTGMVNTDTAGDTLPTFGWTYDADNRVTQFSGDGTITYSYDSASQLMGASYSSPPAGISSPESYSYDANGNRDSAGYSTGPGNRVLSDGTYNYTYDANGNMLTRTQISNASSNDHQTIYTWDYRNRLASVTNKDNAGDVTQTVTYQYDLFNRRIGETVVAGETTSETRFVYDGNQMILQFDKTGTGNLAASDLSRRYLWGPAVDQALAAEDASDNVTWLLADNQGTVRDVVTFASGQTTVADRIYYGVFGAIASQTSASANPGIGYTGQFWDAASCMYYCIARWYDPSTGRYVSADPTGFRAGDANLFRYVFNNPTNWVDPTGEVVGSAVPMLALGVADLGPHAVDKKDLGPRGKGLLEAMPDIRGFLKGQAKQTPGNKELSGVIVKKQDGKCVCVPQNRTDKSGMARPYGRYGWKSNNPVGTIIGTYHTHFPGAAGEPNPSDQDANDSQAKGTPDIGIHYTPDPANPAGGSIYDSWITDEKAGEYQLPREVE